MSGDTRYWKQFATSRISSFKGYLAPRPPSPRVQIGESTAEGNTTYGQSWTRWAGDKLMGRTQEPEGIAVEKISLFPGWAARRFHKPLSSSQDVPFDVEVFVSGFATTLTDPNSMSRSQRAFLRLAKGFASLPKLPETGLTTTHSDPDGLPLSKSTEELLASIHLPPPPSKLPEAVEVPALAETFRRANAQAGRTCSSENAQIHGSSSTASLSSSSSPSPSPPPPASSAPVSTVMTNIHELHANLEARLQPFWSSALSNRTVRLSLFTSEEAASVATALSTDGGGYQDSRLQPVMTREVVTTQDGSFLTKFVVPWDTLCTNPTGLHIAFGDVKTEHNLFVLAQLLPPLPPPVTQTSYRRSPTPSIRPPVGPAPEFGTCIKVPLSLAPVRVISDIDDTVKMANVLSGARAVFHTVFVRSLSEIVIPGMGDWYTEMWERGVRFHYVSNGPYEILPVVNEFFQLAHLPPGSIRLRSYGRRSLFKGFLSAPAARKREGVADILDNFQESQFILVGDSGEQDLELYASIAAERPRQVLAVFIRDVRVGTEDGQPKPLGDPNGSSAGFRNWAGTPTPSTSGSGTPKIKKAISEQNPRPSQALSRSSSGSIAARTSDYFSSQAHPSSKNGSWVNGNIIGELEPARSPGGKLQKVSESEWKRFELQMRVDKARSEIPDHIPLRVFRNPKECVEAQAILDKAQGPKQASTGFGA